MRKATIPWRRLVDTLSPTAQVGQADHVAGGGGDVALVVAL
jgi:hypothetical protein